MGEKIMKIFFLYRGRPLLSEVINTNVVLLFNVGNEFLEMAVMYSDGDNSVGG